MTRPRLLLRKGVTAGAFYFFQYHHGSSNHTLSRASSSVDFALLSDRWKCFAVSFSGWYTSSSKPKRYHRYARSRRSIRWSAVWISSWVSFAIYICSGFFTLESTINSCLPLFSSFTTSSNRMILPRFFASKVGFYLRM